MTPRIPWNMSILMLAAALLSVMGCAKTPALPATSPVQAQGISRIDQMRIRADGMITEMQATRERLRQYLSDDSSPSATCSTETLKTMDLYIRDSQGKRDGLNIGLAARVQERDITPYKTDFGAIAENAGRVKDTATVCGLNPPPPPPPRNPALLVITGIGAGIGAAGLVAGGVLGETALEKKHELLEMCPNNTCPPNAKGIADSKDALAAGSTIAFVAGGSVLALSGIPLIVYFAPRTSNSPQTSLFLYSGRF